MSDLSAATGAGSRRGPSPRTRAGISVVLVMAAVVAGIVGLNWWTRGRFVQSTNDAYLQADQVTVAPKLQGYVEAVLVRDNQAVVAGQPLVRINSANYDAALAEQTATVTARQADITAARRELAEQTSNIDRAQAELAGAGATVAYADREAARFHKLAGEGVETAERAAQAQNQADRAQATLRADEAALHQAQDRSATLQARVGQANAQLGAAQATVRNAKVNLGDTLLRASISGRVGDRTVRVGQFVQPGARLMSLVPVADVYLVANFKETQIGHIRIGQRATVKLDALGGRPIDAVVDSFAPGTGAQFALLPPENATGNFTKIVQRVPVRLRLLPPADIRDHLLPGLSATIHIDTKQAEGHA